MKNILIATDLTVNSDRALERAIRLAKGTGATLHIMHVAPLYQLSGKTKETAALKQETKELIRAYLAGYKGANSVQTDIHVVESGNAFAEIIKASQETEADLIVMGVHNKVGFKDLFVGTTIERVIRKGLKPVLMVVDKPKNGYKSVVVGCDFSESSKSAFNFALQLASGGVIHLVHSYDFSETTTGHRIELYEGNVIKNIEVAMMQKFMKESDQMLKDHNFPAKNFSHKTVKGAPEQALAAEVKKTKAGLLVMGVHSRSGFLSSKLGGVTEAMLANPPCDVLVAKGQ
jgi:nucleotide-binding universal stress UspA family protein